MTTEVCGLHFSKHGCVTFAYAMTCENYRKRFGITFGNMRTNGSHTKLPVFDKNGKIIQHVYFKAAVKQLINNTERGAMGDDVYFLLKNGDVVRSKFKNLKSKHSNGTTFNSALTEEVFVGYNGRKATLFDVYDHKMCFVFNSRVLEVTSIRHLLRASLTIDHL